jgi:hypothetical protein
MATKRCQRVSSQYVFIGQVLKCNIPSSPQNSWARLPLLRPQAALCAPWPWAAPPAAAAVAEVAAPKAEPVAAAAAAQLRGGGMSSLRGGWRGRGLRAAKSSMDLWKQGAPVRMYLWSCSDGESTEASGRGGGG